LFNYRKISGFFIRVEIVIEWQFAKQAFASPIPSCRSAGFRTSLLFLRQSTVGASRLLKRSLTCPFCSFRQIASPHQSYREAAVAIMRALGEYQEMQQLAELEAPADRVDVRPLRKRKASARRKVTVRLSEGVCGRLDVATDRPGVGKSMFVEAALEHFLNPVPSVEALLRERLDDMHARFDHLERDMRLIAETVALHARYHLTVVPPLPEARQPEAVILGDERFKVLAEQVDRRVRERRPLMQETIDRLNSAQGEESDQAKGERPPHNSKPADNDSRAGSERGDLEQTPSASGKTGRGNPRFAQYPKSTAGRAKAASDGGQNPGAAENSDPESSTSRLEASREKPLSKWRLILSVFLPFAAGYYLSFLFRTINASISPVLASDFGLGAAETGLLASVYFLVFAGAQIPIGVLLDRYGPRRVQSVLLVIAVGGATLFGNADSFAELLVGRAMIGLGVAASLMAGLKAIVTWFPKERIAFVNGGMIMLGSLGAVTATAPTDWLLNWIGWRSLFEVLTIATLATAGLIYSVVPESDGSSKCAIGLGKPLTLRSIFSDPRFLRIAPLSATCIGSSWAMHSLWAASWLADVEGFDRQSVINQLFMMAIGISLGALLLGTLADRLRKRGVATELLLAVLGALFMLAELALVLRVPLPSILPWSVVSVVGAATVLSYAIIADYFPVEIAARANGALNLLHFGWAFVVQYGIGLVVGDWIPQDEHYPVIAYQTAFGVGLALQAVALTWFAVPWLRSFVRYLRLSFAPRAGLDGQLALVPAASEGVILEASQGGEW
jgi:MFS family permease